MTSVKHCRLCAKLSSSTVNIFKGKGRKLLLHLKILNSTTIFVSEDDPLTKFVCIYCIGKLDFVFNFRTACQNAQTFLRRNQHELNPKLKNKSSLHEKPFADTLCDTGIRPSISNSSDESRKDTPDTVIGIIDSPLKNVRFNDIQGCKDSGALTGLNLENCNQQDLLMDVSEEVGDAVTETQPVTKPAEIEDDTVTNRVCNESVAKACSSSVEQTAESEFDVDGDNDSDYVAPNCAVDDSDGDNSMHEIRYFKRGRGRGWAGRRAKRSSDNDPSREDLIPSLDKEFKVYTDLELKDDGTEEYRALCKLYLAKEEREKIMSDKETRIANFSSYVEYILKNKISTMPYCVVYQNMFVFKCFWCHAMPNTGSKAIYHLLSHMNNICPFCGTQKLDFRMQKNHVSNNHTLELENKKVMCRYCDETFKEYDLFNKHLSSHFKHDCVFCSHQEHPYKMFSHLKSHHKNELNGTCWDCSLFHNDPDDLVAHLRGLVKLGFVCRCCKIAFHNELQLKMHYRIFGSKHMLRDDLYAEKGYVSIYNSETRDEPKLNIINSRIAYQEIVNIFKTVLKTPEDIVDLRKLTYKGIEIMRSRPLGKTVCLICKKVCSVEKVRLYKHIQNHLLIACHKCCRFFPSTNVYVNHMRRCCSVTEFKCFICDLRFGTLSDYKAHVTLHFRSKICFYCNEIVLNVSMTRHAEQHLPKKHVCDKCAKQFMYLWQLNNHIKSAHGGTRRTAKAKSLCSVCGKVVKRYGVHSQCARENKELTTEEFICDYCSKIFYRKNNLIIHIRMHMNDTPFTCTFCKKSFKRVSSLDKHVKDMHSKQKWLCPNFMCRSAFSYRSGLDKHMQQCSKRD